MEQHEAPGKLFHLSPCKTAHQIKNALDFLNVPRSFMLSKSDTSPAPHIVYVHTKDLICVCSAATSPAFPHILQAIPLTTLMETPAKQALSQFPLSFWKEICLGKPRCVVGPWTWTLNESTLVLPGEGFTTENASQVKRN